VLAYVVEASQFSILSADNEYGGSGDSDIKAKVIAVAWYLFGSFSGA